MDTEFDLVEVSKVIESGVEPTEVVPFTYINNGSDRYVFRVDSDRVIKFSIRPSSDPNQNIREAAFYNNIEDTGQEHKFAKVLKSVDGRYIIQQYADTSSEPTQEEIEEWKESVESKGIVVHDCEPSNFGYRKGELVMVDYAGCFVSRTD